MAKTLKKKTEETKPKADHRLKVESAIKSKYDWLKFDKQLFNADNLISREVLFFLVVFTMTASVFWGWAHGRNLYLAELNPNYFHEGLGTVLAALAIVWAWFKLYMTSDSYLALQEAKAAAEKAEKELRRMEERERKDKAFMKIVIAFESAKTFEERVRIMGDLLAVGVESPTLRQRTVDALLPMNDWMVENAIYLRTQNLISWRLKNTLFETSSRFQENSETQDASIKIINIVESIIKKHLEEYVAGHNSNTLKISKRCLPTLNLSAKDIPAGSLEMADGHYWQSSFSESNITGISFANSDFYGSSFWRAELNDVDFENTVLQQGKLRTNVQMVKNLKAEEFFGTKEWELCFISLAQEKEFFGETPTDQDPHFAKWLSTKIRRDKLYFGIGRL